MWLFYVDEYGDDSMAQDDKAPTPTLKAGVSEWFVLAAVGIPDHSRLTLAAQIGGAKDRAFPGWRTRSWKGSEIKGRHLRYAESRLDKGLQVPKPLAYRGLTDSSFRRLCRDLGWSLRKYRPLIYIVAVDKKGLLASSRDFPPIGIAYTYLQQRLALLTEQVLGPSEGAIIVADEQIGHENHFKAGIFHQVRRALSRNLTTQPDFNLLLDKPVWINADLSEVDRELLQLADIAAYSAGTACVTNRCPIGVAHLWDDIASCLALHWSSHKVPGGGFTIYPKPIKPRTYPTGL